MYRTRDEDVGVERVADGAEALRGPAPPGVRGARVQHDRRAAAVGDDRRGRLAVVVGQLQHRLVPDGPRADQPNHFEVPEDLGLVVRVAHPAVQRWRVIGAQPGGDPRAQRGDQRVGVAAAAVQLDRQVEALGAHRGHERRVDVRQRRQLHHPVDRPRAPGQEPGMPRGAEQHDLGRGIAARSASSAGSAKMKSPSALARSTAIFRTSGSAMPVAATRRCRRQTCHVGCRQGRWVPGRERRASRRRPWPRPRT